MESPQWKRHSFLLLTHFAYAIMFMQRLNLSIAIVAMVAPENQTNITKESYVQITSRTKEFNWDEVHQGMLLSAFFYGCVPPMIPAGVLVDKYGGKMVAGVGLFMSSVFTLLTPAAASTSFSLVMAVRVFVGLSQGIVPPALMALLRNWSPTGGKNRIIALATAGVETGSMIAFLLGGILCASKFLDGWPSVFYMFGVVGIIWFIVWIASITETPDSQSSIGNDGPEYQYLQSSTAEEKIEHNVPWVKILLSIPFWAVVVGIFCHLWIWVFIITDLPLYYKRVLGISVMQGGMFSTLPIILAMVTHTASGYLSDYLDQRWCVKTTRRFTASIGFFPTALLLIIVSYTKEGESTQAIIYMTLFTGFLRSNRVTFLSNITDLSPTYTGVLMGLAVTIGTTAGIGAPLMTGFFTNHDPSRENYRVVFFINAGICVFGGLFFSAFVSGNVQDWDPANGNDERDAG